MYIIIRYMFLKNRWNEIYNAPASEDNIAIKWIFVLRKRKNL